MTVSTTMGMESWMGSMMKMLIVAMMSLTNLSQLRVQKWTQLNLQSQDNKDTARDKAILLLFSPIFLSSNSFYFYLFCSMLQYFAQCLTIKLAIQHHT